MDTISETRLAQVMPALADKIRQLATELQAAGTYIRVVQALRTNQEQDALYAQGRTAPGKIVTNCRGGYSYHNFGLAVDCVPSTQGPGQPYDPDWNESHPVWKQMIESGVALGLTAGALWRSFPDAPHFQINGRFPEGAPDDEVRQLFSQGGLAAVWAAVGG